MICNTIYHHIILQYTVLYFIILCYIIYYIEALSVEAVPTKDLAKLLRGQAREQAQNPREKKLDEPITNKPSRKQHRFN